MMEEYVVWAISPILFVLSYLMTWGMRHFAITKELLDIPNHRSSHSLPTPRGGGVSFVMTFLAFLIFLKIKGLMDTFMFVSFMGACVIIATLGISDDKYGLPSHWRLLGHFSAAAIMIFAVQGLPPLNIFFWTFPAGTILNIVTLVYLTWCINLYNFMDGLDGLASIELIFACLGAVGLYWLAGVPELIALPFALAVSVLGFLCWNFPPARIFMGDVGSNFLGLLVGVFSMQAARVDEQFFWSWLILLGVFFVDATFTLLRRFIQGFKVFEAHQSHAYQKAVNAIGGKHLPVVLTVLLINMFWLMPIAFAVGLGYIKGVYGLLMAYTPLILLSLKWKAGVTENHTVSAELA